MNKYEKTLNILTVAVFLVLLYTLTVIFLLKPAESFSEEENRKLQQFPEWSAEDFFDGTYSTKINEYFADQFPFRNTFVGAKALVETALLKQENNGVLLGENGQLAVRGSTLTYFDEDGQKQTATVDFYFPDELEEQSGYIRELKDSLTAAGRQFALVMPPRTVDVASSAFRYPADHSEALLKDVSRLFSDCNFVDLAGEMKTRFDAGEYVYYKTDHHWTTLGAYYAYCAVMEQYGLEPYPLESFTREQVSDSFYGTTYSKGGFKFIAPDPIEYFHHNELTPDQFKTTVYKWNDKGELYAYFETEAFYDNSFLTQKDKYSAFLSGTNPLTVIERKDGVERPKMLIYKDSFANSLAPFLALHFDLVIVNMDDYITIQRSYVAENAADAEYVLVIYNLDNLLSAPKFNTIKGLANYLK